MKKKFSLKLMCPCKLFWIISAFALFSICGNVFADDWADSSCQSRMKLTFDNSASSQALTDFPVLVKLNSSRINYGKTTTTDIRFYDDSTLLSKETEDWNAAGDSFVWVKVPQMDDSDSDYIYAYFDCSDTNLDDPTNVWDAGYVMVHHLAETSGNHFDSTLNDNDGVPGDGDSDKIPNMNAVGIANGADEFDGSNDCVPVYHNDSLNFGTGDFTISAWINTSECGDCDILRKGNMVSAPQANYKMEVNNNKIVATLQGSNSGSSGNLATASDYTDGLWHHAVMMRNSGVLTLYVDGELEGTDSAAEKNLVNDANMSIGSKDGCADDHFNGFIDEVRISNTARSPDWIKASNLAGRDQLITYGPEEITGELILSVSNPQETTYLTTTIPLEGSTNINADISYSLDGGPSVSVGTDTQSFSTSLTGLSYADHTVVVTAADSSDSLNTASETINFTVVGADAWADTNCLYRTKITFDNSASSTNLINFPVLVKLDSARIDYGKTDATDIRFYDDSTLLSKETEDWNESGYSFIWVNIPQVDNTATDYIYAYYGCSDTDSDDAASVWAAYEMVQHLQETTGTAIDSTGNGHTGTPNGTMDQNVDGQIDGADNFDGSNDYISIPDHADLDFGTGSFSYSFWFKSSATGTQYVFDKKGGSLSETNAGYKMGISSVQATGFSVALGDGTTNVRINTGDHASRGGNIWAMFTVVVDRTAQEMRAYINGDLEATGVISGIGDTSSDYDLILGSRPDMSGNYFSGVLDEARIIGSSLSADWVKASYLSESDMFASFGSEEANPDAIFLSVTSPEEQTYTTTTVPLEGTTNIDADISYSLDGGPSVPVASNTQSFSTNLSGLSYDDHTVVVTAEDSSDPSNTSSETINFTVSEPDEWADTNCLYRKKITFDNSAGTGALVDFPVLIKLDSTRIDYSKAPAPEDIRFYDDLTLLFKETEDWDDTGESFIWVNVPQVDMASDTDYIYAYYGCSDTNSDDAPNVWNSSYVMVHHFEETSGNHFDSTSNGNDGEPGGGEADKIPNMDAIGIANGADAYDGLNDCVVVAHDNSLNFGDGDFTISAWVKYGTNNNDSDILRKGNLTGGTAPQANYKLELVDNKISAVLQGSNFSDSPRTVTSSATYSDNQWHNAVMLRNNGTLSLYVDGQSQGSISAAGFLSNEATMGIGSKDGCDDDHIDGILDEIRISNAARNVDWINASYLSTKDQFVSFGSEETAPESCPWDYDGNGYVDGYDLWRFIEEYAAGTVDADDLADFANLFGGPCP